MFILCIVHCFEPSSKNTICNLFKELQVWGIFLNITSNVMLIANGFQTRLQTSSKTDHTVTSNVEVQRRFPSVPPTSSSELLVFFFGKNFSGMIKLVVRLNKHPELEGVWGAGVQNQAPADEETTV